MYGGVERERGRAATAVATTTSSTTRTRTHELPFPPSHNIQREMRSRVLSPAIENEGEGEREEPADLIPTLESALTHTPRLPHCLSLTFSLVRCFSPRSENEPQFAREKKKYSSGFWIKLTTAHTAGEAAGKVCRVKRRGSE